MVGGAGCGGLCGTARGAEVQAGMSAACGGVGGARSRTGRSAGAGAGQPGGQRRGSPRAGLPPGCSPAPPCSPPAPPCSPPAAPSPAPPGSPQRCAPSRGSAGAVGARGVPCPQRRLPNTVSKLRFGGLLFVWVGFFPAKVIERRERTHGNGHQPQPEQGSGAARPPRTPLHPSPAYPDPALSPPPGKILAPGPPRGQQGQRGAPRLWGSCPSLLYAAPSAAAADAPVTGSNWLFGYLSPLGCLWEFSIQLKG